jgi:hypothetical protein
VTDRPVRVFVDGRGVEVSASATALDAVHAFDPTAAARVSAGERAIADSRGIVVRPDAPVHGGAIFRLVSARARRGDDTDSSV